MRSFELYQLGEIKSCIGGVLEELAPYLADREKCQDVKLCLYELLGNAFEHGRGNGGVHLAVKLRDRELVMIVYEKGGRWEGPAAAPCRCLDEGLLDEGGRGLFLVDRLSKEWSFCDDCHGIRVVIELKGGNHV